MLGVTLIELMIALSVFAILAALAAPSFQAFIASQRIRSASSELVLQLTLARSEAIKQNGNVTVASVTANTLWQGGWKVTDAGGEDIRKQSAMDGLTITASAASVVYNRSGRSTSSNLTFLVADSSGTSVTPRCVTVGLTGQPVAKSGSC